MMLHRHFEAQRIEEQERQNAAQSAEIVPEVFTADDAETGKQKRGRPRKASDDE